MKDLSDRQGKNKEKSPSSPNVKAESKTNISGKSQMCTNGKFHA